MDPFLSSVLWIASFTAALVVGVSLLLVSFLGMRRLRQFRSWQCPFDSESDARGLKQLKDWLSTAQLECYERHQYFDVVGSDSSKVYRIHNGQQTNIEQLDSNGQPVCRWCFVPEGHLVSGDVMLAQKIALETYESGALGVANRFTILGSPADAASLPPWPSPRLQMSRIG